MRPLYPIDTTTQSPPQMVTAVQDQPLAIQPARNRTPAGDPARRWPAEAPDRPASPTTRLMNRPVSEREPGHRGRRSDRASGPPKPLLLAGSPSGRGASAR